MLVAIILAAGDSTRMGRPKALLPDPAGRPFVARVVRTFAEAHVPDIVIVTGRQHDAIVDAIATDGPPVSPRCAINPRPWLGQLSSLRLGLDVAETGDAGGVLVTPVDIPMFQASTVRALVQAWELRRPPVVRPAVGDRHGHPVLFDRVVFDALRSGPLNLGARGVVRAWSDQLINVPVDDEGCLMDIDTPADYASIVARRPGSD